MRTPALQRRRLLPGFTLTELLVCLSITSVLAVAIFMISSRALERARRVVDISQMRQINSAILSRAVERNGIAYTRDEVGNSSYRQWDDDLSLCQVLEEYISNEQLWICPNSTKRQQLLGNSYAWSRAKNLTETPIAALEKPENTLTLWNAFSYTLPSVRNVPDGGANGGPRVAGKQYQYRPWDRNSAVHWFYLDGHVEMR